LLDIATSEVVHRSCRVDLRLKGAGDVGELRASQNVEVIVGSVAPGVAFGADGSAEDNEVFSDA